MNFKNIKKFLKKNYKKIIVVCLIMLLFSNKMYENFSTTDALNAVASTEKKVNDMASNVGPNNVDFKSGIRLSKNWMNGANATNSEISNDTGTYKKLMVIGNKSSGTRKVGIWDHLDVHGNQGITGSLNVGNTLTVNGINNKKKSWYWKEGSAQLANGKGLHYLDRHAVHCKEGEFMSGIKWLRSGNNLKTTILCSKLI
jgi:hypothetical protein